MKECPKDWEADGQMESKLIKAAGAQITSQDSAGYVTGVKVGEETLNGETFRDTYGLLSSCFELQEFEGKMRVTTKGIGHGLGIAKIRQMRWQKKVKNTMKFCSISTREQK